MTVYHQENNIANDSSRWFNFNDKQYDIEVVEHVSTMSIISHYKLDNLGLYRLGEIYTSMYYVALSVINVCMKISAFHSSYDINGTLASWVNVNINE